MLKKISLSVLFSYPMFAWCQNNVGIGTITPSEKLHVVGNVRVDTVKTTALRLSGSTPAAGKVLTSDATGNATWQNPSAGGGTLTDAYNFGGAGAGRIINANTATVRIDGGYGLQVYGTLGIAFPENPGIGSRMFFNPGKAAFRAGYVNAARPGIWLPDSVGTASIAMGSSSKANGEHSIAIGIINTASGTASVAMGISNTASGVGTVAIGNSNTAEGQGSFAVGKNNYTPGIVSTVLGGENNIALGSYSLAMGLNNRANANFSAAIGEGLVANAYGGLVIGRYNDTLYAAQNGFTQSTALFTIGNGVNSGGGRNTAFTVWYNGNTGVNTGTPKSTLDVNGTMAVATKFINSSFNIGLDETASVFFFSGTGQIGFPTASLCPGRMYHIINQTTTAKSTSAYTNFSGASVTTIPANAGVKIISDGTAWRLIP